MRVVRRLSDVEASFALLHAELSGTTQVATLVTVDGLFERRTLTDRVRGWARRLPILRLRIVERQDELWFAEGPPMESAQLRIGLLPAGRSAQDLLAEELNDVLATGGPLWRLRVAAEPAVGRTHLLFVRNHAISDGYSTSWIVRELLGQLFDEPGLLDPAHTRVARDGDELTLRAEHADRPGELPGAADGLPFFERRPWPERGTGFHPTEFSPAESQAVKRFCQEGGITVNQFFAAALTEAFAAVTGRTELDFFTALSLRGRYREAPALADLGCFITVLRQPVRADGQPLRTAAQRYRSGFEQAAAAWRPARREHAAIRGSVRRLAELEAFPGICLTNLGVLDPALGPHAERVAAFRTVVNRTAANYAVVLHLSTFKGAFEATLAYGTPAMDPAVAADTARLLRELALAELAVRV